MDVRVCMCVCVEEEVGGGGVGLGGARSSPSLSRDTIIRNIGIRTQDNSGRET